MSRHIHDLDFVSGLRLRNKRFLDYRHILSLRYVEQILRPAELN